MARPLRIEYPDACYHVSNRGEDFDRIFPGPTYFQAFLDGVAEAASRLNVDILGYCLLKNAYHLLITTPEGNLSRFMRQVDGLYTQNFQRMRNEAGPVFKARYKSVLVQPEKYLLGVSRYIHALPRQGKHKVETWQWSSLPAYLNKAKVPAWLNRDAVLAGMGKGPRPNARYGAFVADGVDAELVHFYGKKNLLSILGDARFRQRALNKLAPGTLRGKSKGPQARLRPSISTVVAAVAKFYKVPEKSIYQAARGPGSKNIPRWTAMYLCQEVSGVTLQEIARRFGLKRYGTVSTTIGKLKQEFDVSPKSLTVVKKLRATLSP
jgi:REP element-mobilizing transposase RayT